MRWMMGTTESLRTSENTEPLEEFSLNIPFPVIFSGFSAAQLSQWLIALLAKKIDANQSTFDG